VEKAQKAEVELLRKQRDLDDAKRELDLTIEKRIQDGLLEVRSKAKREAEEALELRVREKDETIASMKQKIEELKRKAEQGAPRIGATAGLRSSATTSAPPRPTSRSSSARCCPKASKASLWSTASG
jgi:hypothetical protein